MVNSLRHQPSGSPSKKSIIISLNPRATSYESMDVRKETMFSKPLCKTAVWSHLHLPRDAVTFFETLIVGSSTAAGQNVTYVILFYDDAGKVWEFTYRRWRKRDGYDYVFSNGWLNFVKAKELKVNDTVTFLRGQTNKEQFFIRYTCAGNINEAIQQPSGGDSGQPVARVRVPEITVPRVGSPFLNASGSVPNTAVTDHRPMPNSGQIISDSSLNICDLDIVFGSLEVLNICDLDIEFGSLEFPGHSPPHGTEIPAPADGQYSIQNGETPAGNSQYHQSPLEELYENLIHFQEDDRSQMVPIKK